MEMNHSMSPRPEPPKKKSSFGAALGGAIVGGGIVGALFLGLTPMPADQTADEKPTTEQATETTKHRIDISTDVSDVAAEVADAVVGITNVQTVHDFWSSRSMTQEMGTGSGVIYKKDGKDAFLVTNNHVVEGAEELEVTFDDGTKTEGEVVGTDVWTDLAVVRIDAENVKTVIEFGDSDALKRGEQVMAIGNPLGLGFSGSVTVGVVSGKDRSIPIDLNNDGKVDWQADVLQTDAAINPGNSGGALVNMAGQLVGINSMKISKAAVEGIGLAIPVNLAVPIIEQLEQTGEVHRPTMGVSLYEVQNIPSHQQQQVLKLPKDVKHGVVVMDVAPLSAAEKAGLQEYDVIVEMDGEPIEDMVSLRKYLYNEKRVGDELTVTIYREGQKQQVRMHLADGNTF